MERDLLGVADWRRIPVNISQLVSGGVERKNTDPPSSGPFDVMLMRYSTE